FVLAGGDALRRDDDHLPGAFVLGLMLLAPPLGGLAWYVAWRRLYPDAARRARRQRSRAAQEALKALRDAEKRDPDEQARRDADLLRQAQDSFAEAVRLRDEPEKARPLFRQSADQFEELRHRGAANPALFRDAGNACLLAGDLPGAVLAYRRGLRLAPDDREL